MKKVFFIAIIIVALIAIGISGYVLFKDNAKVTISFITNNDSKLDRIELKKGDSINLPILEREGYEFLGWYLGEEKIDSNYKFNKNTILSAKWDKEELLKRYTVTFKDGQEILKTVSVKEGEKVVRPEDPKSNDNYFRFNVWILNGKEYDFDTPVTQNIILSASWYRSGRECTCDDAVGVCGCPAKPLIYLYPEKKMNVSVKLGNISDVTTIYPRYNDGWSVMAYPDGKLIDNKTGRNLYGLYWEGKNYKASNTNGGFVVKGVDTIEFLEEKLEILGLNEREAEEFIIYWLPKMEHNKYNYIRFASKEEIDKYMPLIITPKPDTVIRILLEYTPLEKEIKVKEQKLTKVERNGFTVVEWGGTEIRNIVY